MSAFYRIVADPDAFPRWHLDTPVLPSGEELSVWTFAQAQVYDGTEPLHVPVCVEGPHLDFNFGAFNTIVSPAALNADMQERFGFAA